MARPWLVGVAYGQFESDLAFDDFDAEVEQQAISVSVGYRFDGALSARVSVGLILGGEVEPEDAGEDGELDLEVGLSLTGAVAYRVTRGKWFATGTASLGAGRTGLDTGNAEGSYTSTDLRVGVLAGATLWNRVSPYVLARGFGGPVFLSAGALEQTGSDKSHYQLGGGITAALPNHFALQVDASFLGETSVSGGVAMLF